MNPAYLVDAGIKVGLEKGDLTVFLIFLTTFCDTSWEEVVRPVKSSVLQMYLDSSASGMMDSIQRLTEHNILIAVPVGRRATKVKDSVLQHVSPLVFLDPLREGKLYYFNPNWREWKAKAGSMFYKLCNKLGLSTKTTSLAEIVLKMPVYMPLPQKDKARPPTGERNPQNEGKVVPYALFEYFLESYRMWYNNPYNLRFKERDLKWCRVLLEKMQASPYPDVIYKNFMDWAFMTKGRDARIAPLSVGILPYLWDEYVVKQADKFMQTMRGVL